ncbi:MAG: YceI family protein [Planctomycetota bacterium]|nr:YceI family protein [Planctomycetota bacterium]
MNTRTFKVVGMGGLLAFAVAGVGFLSSGQPAVAAAQAGKAPAGGGSDYTIDGGHSSVIFRIKHLKASNFYGRFNEIEGSFTFDPKNPSAGKIEATINAASVDTIIDGRDDHLRKPDFFNAVQFPTISFKSKSIKEGSQGKYELAGDLTLLGQTKPITATLEFTGENDAGPRFGYRLGLEAVFTIKRSDFGMNYGLDTGALGDEVQITVAVGGVRK